ncbi:hypothetical protein ABEB36_015793 [Hypothenemus hampei]|uniref:CCHC-type domain-containing protein n=1 Tax=Hypothenemus hampei TaxID=57062 RepID=A0ABD1DZ24_HYPHA
MSTRDQKLLLMIYIKNKLRGRAAQLVSSRNPLSYQDIKQLLNAHFGDTRDLSSLIQDLQRIKQISNESPLTFLNRIETLNAKIHANINKSSLNNTRIGHIVRASNPRDLLEAQIRIRRELQLSYFETQKLNKQIPIRTQTQPANNKRPNFQPKCHSCGRIGHLANECRSQQKSNFPQISQRPNFNSQGQSFQQN